MKATKRVNQVNRNIDTETAEGHKKVAGLEEITEQDGKRAATRRAADLDDVAEGHRRMP